MDNRELRAFFEEIFNLVNSFENIPIEAKRLALFSAFQIVERQANEAIGTARNYKEAGKGGGKCRKFIRG